MIFSALFLACTGISLTFLPAEIAGSINSEVSTSLLILFQVLGALYFAFSMLNWMAKESVIGGIYNRPIAIANFTHFFIGSLALIKVLMKEPGLPLVIPVLAGIYTLFAILFGFIFYTSPVSRQQA
jgi:hypothetical protein